MLIAIVCARVGDVHFLSECLFWLCSKMAAAILGPLTMTLVSLSSAPPPSLSLYLFSSELQDGGVRSIKAHTLFSDTAAKAAPPCVCVCVVHSPCGVLVENNVNVL